MGNKHKKSTLNGQTNTNNRTSCCSSSCQLPCAESAQIPQKQLLIINAYKPLTPEVRLHTQLQKLTIYFGETSSNWRQNGSNFKYLSPSIDQICLYLENVDMTADGFGSFAETFKDFPKDLDLLRADFSVLKTTEKTKLHKDLGKLLSNMPANLSNLYFNISKRDCKNNADFKILVDSLQNLPQSLRFLSFIAIDCQVESSMLEYISTSQKTFLDGHQDLEILQFSLDGNILSKHSQVIQNFMLNTGSLSSMRLEIGTRTSIELHQELLTKIIQDIDQISPQLTSLSLKIASKEKFVIESFFEFARQCNKTNLQACSIKMTTFDFLLQEGRMSFSSDVGAEISENSYLEAIINLIISTRFEFFRSDGIPPSFNDQKNRIINTAQAQKKALLLNLITYKKILQFDLLRSSPGTQMNLNFWDLHM